MPVSWNLSSIPCRKRLGDGASADQGSKGSPFRSFIWYDHRAECMSDALDESDEIA